MREEAIRAALDNHLYQLGENVQWPNVSFDPGGNYWMRPTLLPAEPSMAALGEDADNRNIGIYQVDIFWPQGTGEGPPSSKAEEVMQQFKRGTVITLSGTTVRIERAYRESGRWEESWYQIPVIIDYVADVAN